MLALILSCALGLTGLRAQVFTQVSYNFPRTPDHATDGAQTCSTSLTMNSLAANGTGQWTSYNPGGSGNWALLGNHLEDPASDCSYHGGIVQTGTLSAPMDGASSEADEIKVTANLEGCVRYVCPDGSRNFFVVQGFDEQVFNATNYQIDYSFKSGTNGMTLADPTSTVPVKTSGTRIFSSNISTYYTGDAQFHPTVTSAEENPRDEFDIASDAKYLYIAWESYDAGYPQIFVTAVQLSDGTVPSGFPIRLGNDMGGRPTIAADVRNSPDAPSFDVAWIKGPGSVGIHYCYMVNGVLSPIYTMTTLMEHPGQDDENYSYAYHARILVGSALGASPSPNGPRAIYAIVDNTYEPGMPAHLVLFKDVQRYAIPGWNPEAAYYVDGMFLNSPHPDPIDGTFPVDDDPIIAFANPYDGQGQWPPASPGTTPFNEYHCLYRLHRTYSGGVHDPLMIVRGADHYCTPNAMNECLNTYDNSGGGNCTLYRPDIIHSFYEDPSVDANGVVQYIGAVNQMGIHCHWRSSTNVHYYMRDSRALDEPMEENTLETYETVVRNGQDHDWSGGEAFPKMTSLVLALWCEPSSAEFALPPGNSHAPILDFQGAEARLELDNGDSGQPTSLVAFPSFFIKFEDASDILQIWQNFDYYGNSVAGSLEHFGFTGSGPVLPTVDMEGYFAQMSGSNGYPVEITSPAVLNIHDGCGFTTTTSVNFTANATQVNCLNEAPYSGVGVKDGFDFCMGSQAFTDCIIQGGRSGTETLEAQIIRGVPCNLPDNAIQFSLTNCLVQNIGAGGSIYGTFQNNPSTPTTNYRELSINGGQFDGASLEFDDPMDPITVANSTFVNIDGDGVNNTGDSYGVFAPLTFGRPSAPHPRDFLSYKLITVSGCTFKSWSAFPPGNNPNGAAYWPCVGIYVKDFGYVNVTEGADPSIANNLVVEDNTFTDDGSELAGSIHAAIYFDNSCGSITGNIIKAPKYMIGIEHDNIPPAESGYAPSLICSNNIENLTSTNSAFISGATGQQVGWYQELQPYNTLFTGACGLFIDNMDGNEQGNILHGNFIGRFGGVYDESHIIFSNIEDNISYGILTCGYDYMGGYHYDRTNPSYGDVGGWNVMKGNDANSPNPTQIYVYDWGTGGRCLSSFQAPFVTFGNTSLSNWSVFGFNDIESPLNGFDIEGAFDYMYLPDPSGNYWGGGDISTWHNVCIPNHSVYTSIPSAPSFPCTEGGYRTKPKTEHPLSVEADTLTCDQLFNWGHLGSAPPINDYRSSADTLEYYVEHCHLTLDFDPRAFNDIAYDYVYMHASPNSMAALRQWLFRVLYLPIADTSNPYAKERYYCNDAIATLVTFNSTDTFKSDASSASIAIEKYLIASGKCPDYQGYLQGGLNDLYQSWHRTWKDTVKDSLLTPWDTTIPTLQEIGFEILLGPQYGAVHNGVYPTSVLGEIGISPNPFVDRTEISYTLNVPATLTVEVYDVLGNKISIPVPSVFTTNGNYTLTLGDQLASGIYYVRFSVPEGEVRTIEFTKE